MPTPPVLLVAATEQTVRTLTLAPALVPVSAPAPVPLPVLAVTAASGPVALVLVVSLVLAPIVRVGYSCRGALEYFVFA